MDKLNRLKSKVIKEFQFYWCYMVQCRNERNEAGVNLAYTKLSEYIELLGFFYDNLDTFMLWKRAFKFSIAC